MLPRSPLQRKSRNAPRWVSSTQVAVKKTGTQFPTSFPRSLFFPLSSAQGKGKKRDPDNIPTSSLVGSRIFNSWNGVESFRTEKMSSMKLLLRKKGWRLRCTRKKSTYRPAALSFHKFISDQSYSCHTDK